jgi:hypothetical protein
MCTSLVEAERQGLLHGELLMQQLVSSLYNLVSVGPASSSCVGRCMLLGGKTLSLRLSK